MMRLALPALRKQGEQRQLAALLAVASAAIALFSKEQKLTQKFGGGSLGST